MNMLETRNNSLIDMARRNEERRNAKNKSVFKDGVNQRASIKQMNVCRVISKVIPSGCSISEQGLCKKRMVFEDTACMPALQLSYYSKNSLFARVFDLVIEAAFYADAVGAELLGEDMDIGIRYTGGLKIKDAFFDARIENRTARALIERLNGIEPIKRRILCLETTDVRLNYNCDSKQWKLALSTCKGSTVWSLMPPVLMLIDFTETDAMRLVELFQLLTHTVKTFRTEAE
jgi:hypothetical protein